MTKQFTASAILRLQEDGKLLVTDKLAKYFPDFPRASEVSLHQLLTHTSGIHSYTGKDSFLARVVHPVSNEELLDFFRDDPYDFNPGDQWAYNNSGYFLLGYIVEKVSGKKFGDFLQEIFFKPLGMNNTGVYTSALKLANEAKGYSQSGPDFKRAPNWDMSWAGGAGALYSTVEDLYKWNEAVFSGKVLKPASMKAAFSPVLLNNGSIPPGGKYGYGWGIGSYRGEEFLQHGGGLDGFVSQLTRFPEENTTIVLLTNVTPPQVNILPTKIAEFYLWSKMDKQESFSQNASLQQDLKVFEGRYDFRNAAVMLITTNGKELFAQLSGQPKFPIYPSSADEFFWKVVEAKIKFRKNEKGEVTGAFFTQGAFEIEAPRLKDDVIANVDTSIYKNYAGKYTMTDGSVITVTTENGRIYGQANNDQRYEFFPVSEKEFVLRELKATVRFEQGADGKVSKLLLDLDGRKQEGSRRQ